MTEPNDRPVGYEEPSREEIDALAAMGIGEPSAPPSTEPPPAADAKTVTPAADVATEKEPEKAEDLPPPFLPPPGEEPPAPSRLDDNIEIDYVGPDGRTLTTTLGKAREAARRLHGLDALQRQLAPYREMEEGAKAIKDPAQRAKMIAEMRQVVARYRAGKADEAPAPTQVSNELQERLDRIEKRFSEADQRREQQREHDARVSVAQGRIDRLVGYTKSTFGIALEDAEIDKTVDRCLQIHRVALSTKDPVRRRQLEDIAANPVEVWLHDNRDRLKQLQVDAARNAERNHVESLRKGAINPGGSAPIGGRAPVVGGRLETMSVEQQDALTPEQYAELASDMLSRMGNGG